MTMGKHSIKSEISERYLKPLEPEVRCRFITKRLKYKHVEKHILLQREEQWHHIFDSELIGNARQEWRNGECGENFEQLANLYEKLLGSQILMACRSQRHHLHRALMSGVAENGEAKPVGQSITAWPPKHRLLIIAKNFVRFGVNNAYNLYTGYRPYGKLGEKAFLRKCRERQAEMSRLRAQPIIADHV